jgi:hypothetical protein
MTGASVCGHGGTNRQAVGNRAQKVLELFVFDASQFERRGTCPIKTPLKLLLDRANCAAGFDSRPCQYLPNGGRKPNLFAGLTRIGLCSSSLKDMARRASEVALADAPAKPAPTRDIVFKRRWASNSDIEFLAVRKTAQVGADSPHGQVVFEAEGRLLMQHETSVDRVFECDQRARLWLHLWIIRGHTLPPVGKTRREGFAATKLAPPSFFGTPGNFF